MTTLPVIPPIVDAPRVVSVTPTPGTTVTTIAVTYPVFGEAEDLTVISFGAVLDRSLWTFTSASGTPLDLLPLPITDGVVTFTPPLTTPAAGGSVLVQGSWQPRQTVVPAAPGISRREYEQTVSTIIAGMRDLADAIATIGSVIAPGGFTPVSSLSGLGPNVLAALESSANGASGFVSLNGSGALTTPVPLANLTGIGAGVRTAAALTVNSASSLIQLDTNAHIPSLAAVGVANGSSAPAGMIGEFFQVIVLPTSPVAIPSNVATQIASMVLTPGDWDVSGAGGCTLPTGTLAMTASLSLSGTALGALATNAAAITDTTGNLAGSQVLTIPRSRFNVTVNTTIFLVLNIINTGATFPCYGNLSARRMR